MKKQQQQQQIRASQFLAPRSPGGKEAFPLKQPLEKCTFFPSAPSLLSWPQREEGRGEPLLPPSSSLPSQEPGSPTARSREGTRDQRSRGGQTLSPSCTFTHSRPCPLSSTPPGSQLPLCPPAEGSLPTKASRRGILNVASPPRLRQLGLAGWLAGWQRLPFSQSRHKGE